MCTVRTFAICSYLHMKSFQNRTFNYGYPLIKKLNTTLYPTFNYRYPPIKKLNTTFRRKCQMTSVHELEKQATPGPLRVNKDTGFWIHLYGPEDKLVAIIPDNDASMETNACLLAHCRNNTIPLLKAAQRIVNLVGDDKSRYEM